MSLTKPQYDYSHAVFKHRPYIRYAQEHKEMFDTFAGGKVISYEVQETVSPLKIPVVYHIHYHLKSIVGITEDQAPVYGDHHIMRLEIPTQYPMEPCTAYMLTDTWHPNIKSAGKLKGRICTNSKAFGRNFSLSAMVLRVGEILQYRNYLAEFRPPYPEDPKVAEWVLEFAEPNSIVNYRLGIYVDDTPLLQREDPALAAGAAVADEDHAAPPEEPTGFSIKPREHPGEETSRPQLTLGQSSPEPVEDGPTEESNPDTDANKDAEGESFSIKKRKG